MVRKLVPKILNETKDCLLKQKPKNQSLWSLFRLPSQDAYLPLDTSCCSRRCLQLPHFPFYLSSVYVLMKSYEREEEPPSSSY